MWDLFIGSPNCFMVGVSIDSIQFLGVELVNNFILVFPLTLLAILDLAELAGLLSFLTPFFLLLVLG